MLPALEAGGVERGTLEMAAYLVRQGHESLVISAGGRLREQLVDEGTTHYCWDIGAKRLGVLLWIRKVRRLLERQKPDIIHLRSRLPAWIAYLAWRKMDPAVRPGLVTTVHGPYTPGWYSAVMARGERVIAISEMIHQYVLRHYPFVDPQRLSVIYRGVDRAQYPFAYQPPREWSARWQQQFPQLAGKYVLTLPARITRWKGHEHFVRLIGLLKQQGIPAYGLIVGEPHKRKRHFLHALQQQIGTAGLAEDFCFTGHRTDLKNILAVSDVVLSLALEPEAFGRTTIEALSLGVPVAGYAHGGVAEQLQQVLPEGAVPVGDLAAMAGLLVQWYRQRPAIKREHGFTLHNMLSQTLSVYTGLVSEKAGSSKTGSRGKR